MEFHGSRLPSRAARSALAVLVVAFVLAATSCGRPSADPNEFSVILVTLDTTRADRLGAYGGSVPTPNLDRVAAESALFEAAISQVPITLPSHASILTGRYPASHGVRHNGLYRLPDSETTLTERLVDAGFRTAGFVAAYVLNAGYGTEQGFETYADVEQSKVGSNQSRNAELTADEVNARVFEWLDDRPDGRFFLWVHYYDPHAPYDPPETAGRTLQGSEYDREISYLDHAFGDLLGRLDRDGVLDRSILVVVGDHGESLGQHREKTHGIFLYEPAVHVPLFVRAPGLVRPGTRVDGPVETVDVAPTVLDLLDLPGLDDAQGRSLVPDMRGERRDGPAVTFAETLMPRLEFGWSELRMIRDERYKYVEAPIPELYDLRADPGELDNLAGSDPGIAADMAATLREWIERTAGEAGEDDAERGLSAEEEAKLRSLGYLGGDFFKTGEAAGALPDPKDKIDEGIAVWAARDRIRDGEFESGVEDLDAILTVNPGNQLALTTRLSALVQLGRIELAEEDALALLAVASEDPDASGQLMDRARLALASIYWIQGREDEALEQHRLAKATAPDSRSRPGGFSNLLLGVASGVSDAERIVDLTLARRPNDGMALSARFEIEMSRGDEAAALRTAERLADAPVGDGATFLRAARMLKDAGRPAKAARCFAAVIAVSPPNADLYGYLGTSLLSAGDLDGAEEALRTAMELRPGDPRGPFYLGNVALARGNEIRARELYARSLEINPQFVPPLVQLARYLEASGRRDEALVVLEDALRRKPDDRAAVELRTEIRGRG